MMHVLLLIGVVQHCHREGHLIQQCTDSFGWLRRVQWEADWIVIQSKILQRCIHFEAQMQARGPFGHEIWLVFVRVVFSASGINVSQVSGWIHGYHSI